MDYASDFKLRFVGREFSTFRTFENELKYFEGKWKISFARVTSIQNRDDPILKFKRAIYRCTYMPKRKSRSVGKRSV